ncbi:methylated-DNA--[protein]-cysteine S-methyltransferase [Aromatoleum bremense]|uniref:Methylated-DNA--[protein]-cysteine S-methyltransferase n=1 Tax=Aromatoleum bremense TaxID=76115 RepID=A0ABX1NV95_9RHOO|nr:methylated-DNA--[protein]-cysteine S-methyltransferase [Aromatoleum bremense]NMG15577.1 methylated-DNA--[protein]-cysteine S-methyltransferase [Aromatoleum bremense]QTQ32901.1 Methylated-DNA-protein-cysteine methyltransferase [Aromatoleum bremense]
MGSHQTDSSGATFAATLSVPFGAFGIRVAGNAIHELVFLPPGTRAIPPDCALAERAATQIYAWLEDPDRPFDLPLATRGTLFQRRVWDAIAAIPRGETRQYAHLSDALGSAARAVGQACRANPFPLVIPCHRVVSATGIGGFAGASGGYLIDAKHWLLAFEANR